MTENKVTTYTFTFDDYKLLHSILPDDPCNGCSENNFCCGCPGGDIYSEKTRPYRDNDIYEFALELKIANDALKSIFNCLDSFFECVDTLKEYCKYVDVENSSNLSKSDVDIPKNKEVLSINCPLDMKLFYFFLDSLRLDYNQYEMLGKVYEVLSKKNNESKK